LVLQAVFEDSFINSRFKFNLDEQLEQNTPIPHARVAITGLTRESATDLMKHGFFTGSGVLEQGLKHDIFQAANLIPRATRLVAFNTEEKRAVGFLCLEENTNWLHTIKYVFVDPKHRKTGVATRLLNHAMHLAAKKGARKVNLNVFPTETGAIKLYIKLGFREIGRHLLGQGFLPQSAPTRLIKRVLFGQGALTKLKRGQNRLFQMQSNSGKGRKRLYEIYRQHLDRDWIDFFEIDADNLISGPRQVWQPLFFRDVLVNHSVNSFALIFSRPFSYDASAELYGPADIVIPSMLEDLLSTLANRGISFTRVSLFNSSDDAALNWFEEKGMKTFEFVSMGKTI
jgi:GNAT superfamily N-acetyltransferase